VANTIRGNNVWDVTGSTAYTRNECSSLNLAKLIETAVLFTYGICTKFFKYDNNELTHTVSTFRLYTSDPV